jgi:hypothetical protein
MKSILVAGTVALAEEQPHPLQMRLTLVLTPFTGNANGMGVPLSEASNFIRTAKNQPFKINFNGTAGGHRLAYPVGLITQATLIENDEPLIIGEAIVWKDQYPDVAEYLATNTAHTSWELYYQEAVLRDGVEWLQGIIFAGTCVVNDPAYKGRTPILAVAQIMELEELQAQVSTLTAEKTELVDKLTALESTLADVQKSLNETAQELTALHAEKTAAEKLAKENQRKAQLSAIGIEDHEQYLSLDDDAFQLIVDVAAFAAKKASASTNELIIPNISGNSKMTAKEVAQAIKTRGK